MVKEIIQLGDNSLTKPSAVLKPAEIGSRETKALIADMIDTLNQDPESSAGLSAVQIGVPKQICIIRRLDLEEEGSAPKWEVVINPKMTLLTKHKRVDWEGCLSIGVGEKRLFGPVPRYSKVKLDYVDTNVKKKSLMATGYLAHIVQHELDHLEGKLFLRYISNPQNIWLSKELEAYLSEHGQYPEVK